LLCEERFGRDIGGKTGFSIDVDKRVVVGIRRRVNGRHGELRKVFGKIYKLSVLGKKVSYGFDLQKLGFGKVKVFRVERGVLYRVMWEDKILNEI
jgi:hypothetical protein